MNEKCFNCGQNMPVFIDITNVNQVRDWLGNGGVCWEALEVGDTFYIPGISENTTVSVLSAETESNYDSYGDATGSGIVVFQLFDGIKTATYKVEGSQSSYGGWDWDEQYTVKVNAVPKTVTVWEREN